MYLDRDMGVIIEYEKDGYVFQSPSGEIPFPVAKINEKGIRKPLSWEEIEAWQEDYINARPELKAKVEKKRRIDNTLDQIYPQLKEMWDKREGNLPTFMDLTWGTFALSIVLSPISFFLNRYTQKQICQIKSDSNDQGNKPYDEMTAEEMLAFYTKEEEIRNRLIQWWSDHPILCFFYHLPR